MIRPDSTVTNDTTVTNDSQVVTIVDSVTGAVEINFQLVEDDNSEVAADLKFGKDFAPEIGEDSLVFEYSSDISVILRLNVEGVPTEHQYYTILDTTLVGRARAATTSGAMLTVADFTRPANSNAPVLTDFSGVKGFLISPAGSATGGNSGVITINSITFSKSEGVAVMKTASSGIAANALLGISNNALQLEVGKAGTYSVAIYGLNGRLVMEKSVTLATGKSSISLGSNLGSGAFVTVITGYNTQVKSILMNR